MTYKKVTAGGKNIIEPVHELNLCFHVEVNHNITAENQVEGVFLIRNLVHKIENLEYNLTSYLIIHAVAIISDGCKIFFYNLCISVLK